MKNKKIPMRTCVVSKEKYPKQQLIRIVKDKDGNVFIDPTSKANGHGIYLKKDKDIINKAYKHKIIDRCLQTKVEENLYEELISLIE